MKVLSTVLSPEPPQQTKRLIWIDYVKGIGIFLVVVGHTLRGLVSSAILDSSTVVQVVDQWIYAFHMPLFFFLSGLFIERSAAKPFKSFAISKLQTIVYPYFLWSFLQELTRFASGINPDFLQTFWHITYEPVMQFWFLYVLFIVSISYAILRRLRLPISGFLIFCTLLYIANVAAINLGHWGVVYMIELNAIYFALGAFVAQKDWLSNLCQRSSRFLFLAPFIGFSLVALSVTTQLENVRLLVPLIASVGIFSSLCLGIFTSRLKMMPFLHQWGLLSLEIFLAHTIFSAAVRIILQKVFHITNPEIHIVLGVLVGIYGSVGLYMMCRRLNCLYVFTLRPQKVTSP